MLNPADAQRHDQVHRLTLELQALRRRIDETIDQLCDLVAGQDISGQPVGLTSQADGASGAVDRQLVPDWLRLPVERATVTGPGRSHRLGHETVLYTDLKQGFLQTVQVGQPRGGDERYGLVLNHADFDGSFLSLVLDARALLADMPAGAARLSLALEVQGTPAPGLSAKCAWRVGDQWSERGLNVTAGRLAADSVAIEQLDPSEVNALDFHIFINPVGRGSFEIRRLAASLYVTPSAETPSVDNVFEAAP